MRINTFLYNDENVQDVENRLLAVSQQRRIKYILVTFERL